MCLSSQRSAGRAHCRSSDLHCAHLRRNVRNPSEFRCRECIAYTICVARGEHRSRPTVVRNLNLRAGWIPVHHFRCGHARARGWAARCCSGRLGGAAAAGRTMVRSPAAPSPVLFSGLLFADSGSGRRWSSGGRGRPMMMLRRVGAAAMVTARRRYGGAMPARPARAGAAAAGRRW